MQVKQSAVSDFHRFPPEIRCKIYEELLKAEKVLQPLGKGVIPHYLIPRYHFQTSILSVNRTFHRETWPILYRQNQFIVLSCNRADFLADLDYYGIPAIAVSNPRSVANFKVRVTMDQPHHIYTLESNRLQNAVLRLHLSLPDHDESEHGRTEARIRGSYTKIGRICLLVSLDLPQLSLSP